MDEKTTLTVQALLTCTECSRLWLEPSERWRLYVDADETPRTFAYCAACAEREFGQD